MKNLPENELLRENERLKRDLMGQEGLRAKLNDALEMAARRENERNALMKGAKAVLDPKGFKESARAIFDLCKDLVGAKSGYVALLSENGEENELLFLDAGGLPCDVDPELPMPVRGLRAEAYHANRAVYHNDFMNSEWIEFMPAGHVILKNVMFAPLILEGKTIGIIGLANKASDFDDSDARVAAGFGELAAIALQNSKHLEERMRAEQDRERLIAELKQALSEVKKLSGLLPICSICKKIRDDKGYWSQIEFYIQSHSDAEFTHSICEECAKRHYPDLDPYED